MDSDKVSREHERDLRRLAKLRVIDDDFMRCVFRNQPVLVGDVLRIMTGIGGLRIEEEETQRDLRRLVGARSVELDVWAKGPDGTEYDVEIQRGEDPYPRRLRYHSACMDVEALGSSRPFSELPEQWVVYVTEGDPFGENAGRYLYEYSRGGNLLGDGTHYLYVNGSYRGDDELGSLMADFCQSDPDKIRHVALADRVRYWKENPEGVREMCEILEEMRDEAMEKGMQKGMQKGARDTMIANVRSLMNDAGWTAQKAFDVLKVPEADRHAFLTML